MVPRLEALLGSTFETRKTSSRRPAIAAPMSVSAAPAPYISAVSMWVMPRSIPRRRDAITAAASASSARHDPWPTAATRRPVEPKSRSETFLFIVHSSGHCAWDSSRSDCEAPRHAQRRLAALVVALDDAELVEAETFVEGARLCILGAQFQIDAEHAGFNRGCGQPLHELASEALAAIVRRNRKKVEMRDFVAEMHDGECGDASGVAIPRPPCNHHGGFRARDEMLDAGRSPRPGQTLLDQIARHFGDFARVRRAGKSQCRELGHVKAPRS